MGKNMSLFFSAENFSHRTVSDFEWRNNFKGLAFDFDLNWNMISDYCAVFALPDLR